VEVNVNSCWYGGSLLRYPGKSGGKPRNKGGWSRSASRYTV